MSLFESQVPWVVLQINTAKLREMKTTAAEFRKTIGDLIFNHEAGNTIHRVIVVSEHVNSDDFKDITWTFCSRFRAIIDQYFFAVLGGFRS